MILGYGELSFAEVLFRFRGQNIRDLKSVFHLCQLLSFTHMQSVRDLRGKAGVVQ